MNWEWFREVGARYGLRGVRVGEASHPGPPDQEWTVPDSVIDALEADLTPPVPSTIPASAGAVMRRLEEIPVISLADSETDTVSTGPDVEDHHFEEEEFRREDVESESENDGMSVVSGDDAVVTHPDPPFEIPLQDSTPPIREAFRRLDGCDVEQIFARRGCVMNSVPFFLKGPFRSALRIALLEAIADEHVRRTRG